MIAAFVIELVIKKSVPREPWETHSRLNWLRISSVAQWTQLALFVYGTEQLRPLSNISHILHTHQKPT